ncbi:hypothetical protein C3L33_19171, partial [Rhododendron williamsianum]
MAIWVLGILLFVVVSGGNKGGVAASSGGGGGGLGSGCRFPAVYSFGDDNSDTGGNAAALDNLVLPNGQTFFGKPSGRYCNGRLIIDFIGIEESPLKSILPRPEDFSKALYIIDMGQNDLANS